MIGLWWLCHIQDVLAAASEFQLKAVMDFADKELQHRIKMTKGGVKCRRKRAVERVHRTLTQVAPMDQEAAERAAVADLNMKSPDGKNGKNADSGEGE